MKEIFVPERNEESSCKESRFLQKTDTETKRHFFFLIHRSVNIVIEWIFAEDSKSAEVMNFSLSKVTCLKRWGKSDFTLAAS